MKKIITIILTTIMVFSFVACGNKEKAEKYCSSCGEGITKDAAFCEHCGADVGDTKTESEDNSSSNTTSTKNPESKEEEPSKPTEASKPTQPSKPSTPAHTHSYSKKVTAATCTGQGYTTYTCSCGHSYIDNYTNPSHSYSNYKCTKCGAFDKSHAYDYFLNWVKTNGIVVNEDSITIYEHLDSGRRLSITYNSTYDEVYVMAATYENGQQFYAVFTLTSKDQNFKYVSTLIGETTALAFSTGIIDGKTYTPNSPLPCEVYEGDSSIRPDFLETSRQYVNFAINFLRDVLSENIPELNIKDLGFTVY